MHNHSIHNIETSCSERNSVLLNLNAVKQKESDGRSMSAGLCATTTVSPISVLHDCISKVDMSIVEPVGK